VTNHVGTNPRSVSMTNGQATDQATYNSTDQTSHKATDKSTDEGGALASTLSGKDDAVPAAIKRSTEAAWVKVAPPIVLALAILGVWFFLSGVVMDRFRRKIALPLPQDVITKGFGSGKVRHFMFGGLWTTIWTAAAGLLCAVVIGMGLALAMNRAKWIERTLYPYAVFLQVIPILAIGPLLTVWFGPSYKSRIITCVIIAIFPIISNTLFGLQSVDQSMHDLFTLRRASRWTRLIKLELPAAMPNIFVALRISAGLSVIGALVGEFFFRIGDRGLGQVIDKYRYDSNGAAMFSVVIVACILGLCVFWLFGVIGKRATAWYESDRVS
jgi:NitT/TauT family transport system permease protein